MQPVYESISDDNIETDSITSSQVSNKVETLKNFYQGSSIKKKSSGLVSLILKDNVQEHLCCKLCKDDVNQSNFIILSCNHIFHINCLADIFFKDIYNYDILDEDYFNHTKCTSCLNKLEFEEIMFLHSKFLANTKSLIKNHETSIDHLESQLKQIKNELRTCYDYKHKLEKQREKSKQIVSILNTIM
jgi:hypothetical protein